LESLCPTNSCHILDHFNSKLEIQPNDASYYELFQEPYKNYVFLKNPLYEEKSDLKAPKIKLDSSLVLNPEIIRFKLDLGRNLKKFPFKKSMTNSEKEELEEIIQDTLSNLKIDGEIVYKNQLTENQLKLQSLLENNIIPPFGEKVFITADNK